MATIAEVQEAMRRRREGDKPSAKQEDKAKARKKSAKPKAKVGEKKLSTLMSERMRRMEEQGYADGGVVRANAGNAKAAQGVGGTINLADGGVVRKPKSAYQKRGGNYSKSSKRCDR